jgi:hypothetical protein
MHISQHPPGVALAAVPGPVDDSDVEPLVPLETLTSREFLTEMVIRMDNPPLGWRPTPDEMTRFIEVAADPDILRMLGALEKTAVEQVVEGFGRWLADKPSDKPPAAS